MFIQIIANLANAITLSCGLDLNQAKTVVYWAIATHALDKLAIMAILVISGPYSTGKSILINLIEQICSQPRLLDGEMSKAELRDKLEVNTTALIEEADKVDEQLILKRYARQTSGTSVKRGSGSLGWTSKEMRLFGGTVLHRRIPFKDPAIDSRSIAIRTTYKPGNYVTVKIDGSDLATIAANIDWSKKVPVIQSLDGRAVDTWMPLFQAAVACNDTEWIAYGIGEVMKTITNLKEGQGYEPNQVVVSKLIALAYEESPVHFKGRIALRAIEKGLKDDGVSLTSWQVGKILRELGFEVKTVGGTRYTIVNTPHLLEVAKQLGIDDDALKGMSP